MSSMKKCLVISAIAADRPGIVRELARAAQDSGCNIDSSRMSVLGEEFALIVMLSGNWNAITKMERMLPALEEKLDATLIAKQTDNRAPRENRMPYVVEAVAVDRPGIVLELAKFFETRETAIEDLTTWTYDAPRTSAPMFAASMTVSIPADLHIGQLRADFTDFCDSLNLDATLEPARSG